VVSDISREDQQKIDMFMQNQQFRGRRRMPRPPVRPLTQLRLPPRLMGAGMARARARPPGLMQRPPFHPSVGNRVPFGVRSANVIRGGTMPPRAMPPRQKILVNPHFRGSSAVTLPSHSSVTQSAFPRLQNLEHTRPPHQHQQFMVIFATLCLALNSDVIRQSFLVSY